MAQQHSGIFCAICNTEKKETNHWWVLYYNQVLKSSFSYPLEIEGEFVHEVPYTEPELKFCGLEHLMLAESRIRNGKDPITGR